MKQRTDEWHKARAGRLTGSNFSSALGLSPYKSRQKLWRQLTGREPADAENFAMQWGTENEPKAIDWYEIESGNIVAPVGFIQHPDHDWCGVSPDGLVGSVGAIECKCPIKECHAEIPEHYKPQCVGVLHICQREWLDFVSWHPDGARIYRITAEETAAQWKEWEQALSHFWHEYVLKDVQPPRKRRQHGLRA